jgi:dimethylargininase
MWTLAELNEIDRSVRERYKGTRVLTEEKVGLSLKDPDDDKSASYSHVRRLTFEVCGMHYTAPQYNIILLKDKINDLAGKPLVIGLPTYSAPHQQINFDTTDARRITSDPTKLIDKNEFLKKFGLSEVRNLIRENTFTRAIVCPPAANFADGLTTVSLGRPVFVKALDQHRAYCEALEAAGVRVTSLPEDAEYPDSTFVEDAAVVTAEWGVITRPGAASRSGEIVRMAEVLAEYYPTLAAIHDPGTVDGGDVCEIGNRFVIGISERTNEEGGRQLSEILSGHGCTSSTVDIRGVEGILHLKSGLTYIGDGRMLVIDSLVDKVKIEGVELVAVPSGEEYAANCIRVNDRVFMPAGFPRLRKILEDLNYSTVELEMSEFEKMDGGVSCLSLRF